MISVRIWVLLFRVEPEVLHDPEALYVIKNVTFSVGYSLSHGKGVDRVVDSLALESCFRSQRV